MLRSEVMWQQSIIRSLITNNKNRGQYAINTVQNGVRIMPVFHSANVILCLALKVTECHLPEVFHGFGGPVCLRRGAALVWVMLFKTRK